MSPLKRCREDKERAYLLIDDITSIVDGVQMFPGEHLSAICQIQDLIEEWALEADLDQPLGEEGT